LTGTGGRDVDDPSRGPPIRSTELLFTVENGFGSAERIRLANEMKRTSSSSGNGSMKSSYVYVETD
jgi:hypothetical protein